MDHYENMTAPWNADQLVISSLYSEEHNQYADAIVNALELHRDSKVFQIGIGDGLVALKIGLQLRNYGGDGVLFVGDFGQRQMDQFEKKIASTHLQHFIQVVHLSWQKKVHLPVEVASIERFLAVNFFQYLEANSPYYDELERVLNPNGCGLLIDWHDPTIPGHSAKESDQRHARMKGALAHEGMNYKVRDDIKGADWVLEVW